MMILYILNLIDLVSTLLAMTHGAVERNPIMQAVMGVPGLFPLVKLIPAYFLCKWLEQNARKSTWAMLRYIAVNIIFAAVVANNFYVFHLMK